MEREENAPETAIRPKIGIEEEILREDSPGIETDSGTEIETATEEEVRETASRKATSICS